MRSNAWLPAVRGRSGAQPCAPPNRRPALAFGCAGVFGCWIRIRRPLPAAVGELTVGCAPMKHLLCTFVFASVAASGFCGTDAWWVFHEREFTNAAYFREIRFATNLPPEVVSAGASANSWTLEEDGPGHLTPAKSWRFIWAVTDDKYYVLHTEWVQQVDYGVRDYRDCTNYWIVLASLPKTNWISARGSSSSISSRQGLPKISVKRKPEYSFCPSWFAMGQQAMRQMSGQRPRGREGAGRPAPTEESAV